MNDLEKRFIVTTLLIIDFSIVATTGLILEFVELDRAIHEMLKQFHLIFGLMMIVLVAIHFYLNWKMYKNEAKIFFK